MTISHVIYLEFARLIVSWQWVTEVTGNTYERPFIKLVDLYTSSCRQVP